MSGRSSLSGIGSVEKTGRKNTWRIRVALGKDPVTGKYRKSPSRTVHDTKSEATMIWLIWQHFFGKGYERIRPASLNPAGVM